MNLFLVLGNHLFDPDYFSELKIDLKNTVFFMKEDYGLATYFRFHKHKIIFFFSAMRAYRNELTQAGFNVHYLELKIRSESFENSLLEFIKQNEFKNVYSFEIEDKFFESRMTEFFREQNLPFKTFGTPMFLTSRSQFEAYLVRHNRPFMKTFYEDQRRRLNILMQSGRPRGGEWSFDKENRRPLAKGQSTPGIPKWNLSAEVQEVIKLVDCHFSPHPGEGKDFWLPVDRKGAKSWLRVFLKERLENFGPYEDAIPAHSEFVYHSVLTPFLNSGLLTPKEVVEETLQYSQKSNVPLASLEGFIRQVIGWREFIRGIYQNFDDIQKARNFWNHTHKLSSLWYKGNTGIPPLDETIRRVLKRGYAHHIERLMVVGSLMLLLEVDPKEAHRWFMEMFIDSSDWVMGPNVYGMALFSDGGVFATKPYICGSNYLLKMGGYPKGEWCDAVDGLYWSFIRKHESFFLKNPRLSMIARLAQKISKSRWSKIIEASEDLKARLVVKP